MDKRATLELNVITMALIAMCVIVLLFVVMGIVD